MSKVMTQTKKDTLVLQVGGWEWGEMTPPWGKKPMFRKPQRCLGWNAANGDEWRRLMREVKPRKGLQRHGWMDGWMDGVQIIKLPVM
jgi:hypothetical protein